MRTEQRAVPHYLVLRADCPVYVLDANRVILRREASQLLRAFAKARGTPTSIADEPWDGFSSLESIAPNERNAVEAYALIRGDESAHQLSLLVSL